MALSWDSADDGDSPDDVGNLSVTGLGAAFTDSGYDVFIYSDSDNNERTFDITVTPDGGDGTTLTVVDSATFSGDYNEGGSGTDENYVVFRGLTAAGFAMDMKSTPGRGAVNAIQVVAVPEPASIVLLLFGVIGVLVTCCRRFPK
jgi:hypothetical protein